MAVRAPVGECCIIAKWSFLQCVNTYCRRPALETPSVEIETLVAPTGVRAHHMSSCLGSEEVFTSAPVPTSLSSPGPWAL